MTFNPFGPRSRTVEGRFRIRELLRGRDINKVCGVDYVIDFNKWLEEFGSLVNFCTHNYRKGLSSSICLIAIIDILVDVE